jgi:hypothetical protein
MKSPATTLRMSASFCRNLGVCSVFAAAVSLLLAGHSSAEPNRTAANQPQPAPAAGILHPQESVMKSAGTVNLRELPESDAAAAEPLQPGDITAAAEPAVAPAQRKSGRDTAAAAPAAVAAPTPAPTGSSPGPARTFQGEFLQSPVIPSAPGGAVGPAHVFTVTTDRIRVTDRAGVELVRRTLASFWTGVVLPGGAAPAPYEPRVQYDRFNDRYIFVAMANATSAANSLLVAISETPDPTGPWRRYFIPIDETNSSTSGRWANWMTLGFNKNWIVLSVNTHFYGTTGTFFAGPAVYAINKPAVYAGATSLPVHTFYQGTSCLSNQALGCGFALAPTVVEDNVTDTLYLLESWDPENARLRLSKLTGTPAAPVFSGGLQFPSGPFSWRFDAARIGSTGGYLPQRDQTLHSAGVGSRIMAYDARIQNAVLRNGSLWAVHTVMLAGSDTPAGQPVGGAANPDIRAGVQWWQINPANESFGPVAPVQIGRIADPTADNCHNGTAGERSGCGAAAQTGFFFAHPSIAVNQSNDALIGFTQLSGLTWATAAYALRRGIDPPNTMRDAVVYCAGQANYNIGSGSGLSRQNQWGPYSAAVIDPLNDADFWTLQTYAGARRDFGLGIAGPWEVWWAQVNPAATQPTAAANLLISEFRLRGPQGVRDEFIELHNPTAAPVRIVAADGSDGWTLATNNGTTTTALTVIPNGTVIPPFGHYLITAHQTTSQGPTVVYSLNDYPGASLPAAQVRGATGDLGFHTDIPDTNGIGLFRTTTVANFDLASRSDAAGFAGLPAGTIFRRGAGIAGAPTSNLQYAFVRKLTFAQYQDTGANENDFRVVETSGTVNPAGQNLGAPGPVNLDAPKNGTSGIQFGLLQPWQAENASPNRERDLTPVPNGSLGLVKLNRFVTNNSGQPITRLRFRIGNITTFPALPAGSDLRLLTTPDAVVGGHAVRGTFLETPANQPFGGGFNSSAAVTSVTPVSPLLPGQSIPVQLSFGVEQNGNEKLLVCAEALPSGGGCFEWDSTKALQPFRILGLSRTGVNIAVTFTPTSGRTYRLERKTQITDAAWESIAGVSDFTAPSNNPAQIVHPSGANSPQSFYRVRLLP